MNELSVHNTLLIETYLYIPLDRIRTIVLVG